MARIFITDRTLADVAYAFKNQNSIDDLKGALNASDLNRIESNLEDLRQELHAIGYSYIFYSKINWKSSDYPYFSEITRIRDNLNEIITRFLYADLFPIVSDLPKLNYVDVNEMEQTLELLFSYVEYLKKYVIYCNEYICGE